MNYKYSTPSHAIVILLLMVCSLGAFAQKGQIKLSPVFFLDSSAHDIKHIAQQTGSTVFQLKNWNFIVGKAGAVPKGTKLLVGFMSLDENKVSNTGKTMGRVSLTSEDVIQVDGIGYRRIYHEVKAKESLFSIARSYELNVYQVKEWNHLGTNSVIMPGDQLVVGFEPMSAKADSLKLFEMVDEAALDSMVLAHHLHNAHLHAEDQFVGHNAHPESFSEMPTLSKVLIISLIAFILIGVLYFGITNLISAKRAKKQSEEEGDEEEEEEENKEE